MKANSKQWPPQPELVAYFEVFDQQYRRSAQRLLLAKPAFTERLKMAMRDLLEAAEKEAATGRGDVKLHRDKSMELSLKWRKNSNEPHLIESVLVEHALLARGDKELDSEASKEKQEVKQLRHKLSKTPFLRLVGVLDSLMSKLGQYALPDDWRCLRVAVSESLARSQLQYRSVGSAGYQAQFTSDMEECGPHVAYQRITSNPLDVSVFLRGKSVFDWPVTHDEEETCEAVLNAENLEGIPEQRVAFLRDVLARVPGGKKARHLVRVAAAILQRGEDYDQCNQLLVAVGVLLLCVKRRFQAGPDCERDYLQIHEFFSGFPFDTNATRINQQLCAKFFDPATQFRTRTVPDASTLPTVPNSGVGVLGKASGKGFTSVSRLTGGYSRGLPAVDQTSAGSFAAADDAEFGIEKDRPPGLEMKCTDPP
mmetsp:Transcript_96200/g.257161  ORF Transcript_96200/g.257161 Transcript_96200/m.257161 type:complete len:424 (+) Transcript_96200:90-1361(+)